MSAPDLIEIDDPADERLSVYRNQKDAWLRVQRGDEPADRSAGLFMAEGELVVRTLIDSPRRVHSVLIATNRLDSMRGALERVDAPVYVAPRAMVAEVVGFDMHRGVLAAGWRGEPLTLEDVLRQSQTLVVLEAIANHDNLGGIFRSAAALAGAESVGMVLCPQCCDPLYRKAVRVSMGTALRVKWTVAGDWPRDLARIAEAGFETLALTLAGGSVDLWQLKPGGKRAVVLGAEGPGLTGAALERCTQCVRIPIDASVDSLNVSVAGAIALAHLCRGG